MNTNGDRTRYLIPRPIARGFEFFPGWNARSVGLVAAGLAAGALLTFVAGLFRVPVAAGVAPGVLVAGAAGILAFPPPTGEPLPIVRIQAMIDYHRHPQHYRYDWSRPDV
jgi:hypothetical protein